MMLLVIILMVGALAFITKQIITNRRQKQHANAVIDLLRQHPDRTFGAADVARALGLRSVEEGKTYLQHLVSDGHSTYWYVSAVTDNHGPRYGFKARQHELEAGRS